MLACISHKADSRLPRTPYQGQHTTCWVPTGDWQDCWAAALQGEHPHEGIHFMHSRHDGSMQLGVREITSGASYQWSTGAHLVSLAACLAHTCTHRQAMHDTSAMPALERFAMLVHAAGACWLRMLLVVFIIIVTSCVLGSAGCGACMHSYDSFAECNVQQPTANACHHAAGG